MNEPRDEDWTDEQFEATTLPEAPGSIHIDSYINGFHVGWTKRFASNDLVQRVTSTKAFITTLMEYGFKPSWNEDTNVKALNGKTQAPEPSGRICSAHDEPQPMFQGVSKTKFDKEGNPKKYWWHKNEQGQMCFGNGYS